MYNQALPVSWIKSYNTARVEESSLISGPLHKSHVWKNWCLCFGLIWWCCWMFTDPQEGSTFNPPKVHGPGKALATFEVTLAMDRMPSIPVDRCWGLSVFLKIRSWQVSSFPDMFCECSFLILSFRKGKDYGPDYLSIEAGLTEQFVAC